MDDDLQQLEAELGRLRPRDASLSLCAALERELGTRKDARAVRYAWIALPVAAALALLAGVVVSRKHPGQAGAAPQTAGVATSGSQPAPQRAAFKPIAAENVLLNSADEGYVTLADGTRAHRLRQYYVDTITWRNPETNASLQWTVPREEVRVVPVSYQ